MENYIEHLVKGKRGTKEYMERGVAIALPFLCFIILYLLSLPLIFFVFSFVLTYYLWNRTSIEYEYLYMAGELSVDIVYHKSSRKKLLSVTNGIRERGFPLWIWRGLERINTTFT